LAVRLELLLMHSLPILTTYVEIPLLKAGVFFSPGKKLSNKIFVLIYKTKEEKMHKGFLSKVMTVAALLVLVAGALTAQQTQPYTDTADLTEKIRETLGFVKKINNNDSIPVFAMFYDSVGEPIQGVKLELDTKKAYLEGISDENGEVVLWVSRKDHRKIKARAYGYQPFKVGFNFTFSGESESERVGIFTIFKVLREARNMPIVTGEGMEELKEGKIRVLYPAGYEEGAQITLDAMLAGEAVIDSVVGMRLAPFKAILSTNSFFRLHAGGGWGVDPEPDSSRLFGTFVHEWVETSLDKLYGADYDDENNIRWIGDGLANYAGYTVSGLYYPQKLNQLYWENHPDYAPDKTYDLKKWKNPTVTNPWGGKSVGFFGYLIAPYFWAKAVEKSGNPELIPQFLEAYRISEDKSSDTAIAILSRLSGLDIEVEMVITGKEFRENVGRYWPEPPSSSVDESEKE